MHVVKESVWKCRKMILNIQLAMSNFWINKLVHTTLNFYPYNILEHCSKTNMTRYSIIYFVRLQHIMYSRSIVKLYHWRASSHLHCLVWIHWLYGYHKQKAWSTINKEDFISWHIMLSTLDWYSNSYYSLYSCWIQLHLLVSYCYIHTWQYYKQ